MPDKSYIYIISETDDEGDMKPWCRKKCGHTINLDSRMKKFKAEQWGINLKYIRIYECPKKLGAPDKTFHGMFEQVLFEHCTRISKNKELFIIDNMSVIDDLFNKCQGWNSQSKYYDTEELINILLTTNKKDNISFIDINGIIHDNLPIDEDILKLNKKNII